MNIVKRMAGILLSSAVLFSNISIPKSNAETSTWKFDFGGNGTANGFVGVSASDGYDSSRGYGFHNTGSVKNVSASGSNELGDAVQFTSTDHSNTFDVDLPNGLYQITVHLGDTNRTSIYAEDCLQIINMTGNNATDTFCIPITDGQLNIMATEGKANYPFTLSSLEIQKLSDDTTAPPTVWICGDSTVCNYYPLDSSVQAGWGQMLGDYIDKSKWNIRNMAASGQYAKGFVDSGMFDAVLKYGKSGDIYIISIGINDTNYSNADEYKQVVSDMAKKATDKGIKVVLIKQQGRSGDVSRNPLLSGRWFGTQLDEIGNEQNLQVVDLFNLAQDYFVSIGQDATNALYMNGDTLHPNREGAKVLAEIISKQIDFDNNNNNNNISHSGDTIYIAGDSTVQSYKASAAPQQGWGYYLKDYLTYDFEVENHALAGRSSKSFYNEGRLKTIDDKIKKNDYLLIQFGINDSDYTKEERYAPLCGNAENPTEGSYEHYIEYYVNSALEHDATPVLVSPVLGLKAYSNDRFNSSYTGHIESLKKIADYYNIPFINLNQLMVDDYNKIGYDAAYKYHMCGAVEGSTDQTHFCEAGAENAAKLLTSELNKIIAENDKNYTPADTTKKGADIPDGKYMIKGVESGLYLDVEGGIAQNGTNVQVWGADKPSVQNTWKLKSVGDGYYQIYSCVGDGSFLLDLNYGKTENGTNIQIFQDTKADAQLFKFYEIGGKYAILTKSTKDKSSLDVYAHGKENGVNICQWEYSGGYNQLWELVPVEAVEDSSNIEDSSSVEDSSSEIEQFKMGDVDQNGTIDSSDALMVLKHIVNIAVLDENQIKTADTTHDGEINTLDALKILKYIVGLISDFD